MQLITDILRHMRKGVVVDEATVKMASVVRGAVEHKAPGKLTIELTVKPQKGDSGQVTISAKVTSKVPGRELPDSIFFATEDGDLVRNDPNQAEMFGDAGKAGAVVREVG